jgi:hypothetical protein
MPSPVKMKKENISARKVLDVAKQNKVKTVAIPNTIRYVFNTIGGLVSFFFTSSDFPTHSSRSFGIKYGAKACSKIGFNMVYFF